MPTDYRTIAEKHVEEYGKRRKHLGIYRSLYADKTHFIYELIQNANDAHARNLTFLLRSGELIICNDGRLFTEKDVRSICSIGRSTKDLTQAGAFGIGFKAVYAYTNSPEIYSGDEHFRIREFVIPEAIDAIPSKVATLIDNGRTILRLPFNNRVRPIDLEQLQKGLRDLHHLTLLFLRSLESIRWIDEITGESGEYRRCGNPHPSIPKAQNVTLRQAVDESEQDELRFIVFCHSIKPPEYVVDDLVRQVEADDEDEAEEERERIRDSAKGNQYIEVAFSVIKDSIVPLDNCVFFSYLPTEKETHLRFLLQARYQTTPARDNIPDSTNSAWNGWLIEEAASFLPAVIKQLKDANYLTPSFFDVLPIEKDGVPQILQPVVDSLTGAIRENKYIPLQDGQYGQPDQAFYPHSQDLRKILSSEDLATLTKTPDASWLHPEIRDIKEHERRFEFMQLIGVRRVDASKFISWISEQGENWIKGKDDGWIRDLYLYLSRQKTEWEGLKEKPLIRLENGEHVSTQVQSVFLPTKDEELEELSLLSEKIPLLRATLLNTDSRREVELFLREIGVKPLNAVEIIRDWFLPHYSNQTEISINTARIHLRFLLRALDKVPATEKRKLIEELNVKPILLARNISQDESLALVAPKDVYLPSTYTGKSELETYFSVASYKAHFLDEGYIESNDELERWRNFVLELGCATKPRLITKPLSSDRKQEIRNTFRHGDEKEEGNNIIEGLESFLTGPLDYDRAMLLWRIIEGIDVKSLQGKYQWDNDYRQRSRWQNEKSFDTDTLILLKNSSWLLDDQNIPRKPAELFASTPENRRLLGNSVSYLHPEIDLTDRPDTAKLRARASMLGVHLRADTTSVINYIRSLSETNVDPKVVRTLYRFLDDNHAKLAEDFSRDKLLLTPTPRYRWWKSNEVYWEDESAVFGEDRGYLEHYYPESLKLFFLGIGVALNAQPLDYLEAIQKLSLQQEVTSDNYMRLRNLYRRLWNAIQEDKKLSDNAEQKLIGSTEWNDALASQYWIGRQGEQYSYYRLEQLVWNDHSYIAHLFEDSLPFWTFEDLREFRDYLNVQPCSQASVIFQPEGAREQSIAWSERVRTHLYWIRSFLNSPRWKEQHSNTSFEEIDKLQVWLVERANISFTLKGDSILDTEPCFTHFGDDGVLWITSEVLEEEYPDYIGDALQSYFRVSELREFVKDLLTRNIEDVLRIWQKRGLEVSQSLHDLDQLQKDVVNADQEDGELDTTEGTSEHRTEDNLDSTPVDTQERTSDSSSTSTFSNQVTGSSSRSSWSWRGNFGGGGEGEAHRTLKERVAANPNLISSGLKLVKMEYEFPSLDCVDILFETEQRRPVPVEIKTHITPGDYKGVWQSVKYKHLAAALYKIRCEDVRSVLVAYEIPDDVKAKCVEVGIEILEITPTTK